MVYEPYIAGLDGSDKILDITKKDPFFVSFKNKIKAEQDKAREEFRPFCSRCALDALEIRQREREDYIQRLTPKQTPNPDQLKIDIDLSRFGEWAWFDIEENKGKEYLKIHRHHDKDRKLMGISVDFQCKNGHGYTMSVDAWNLDKVPFIHNDKDIDPDELDFQLKRSQLKRKERDELLEMPTKKLEIEPTKIEDKRGKKK